MQYLTPKFWRMTIGFLVLVLFGLGVVYSVAAYERGGLKGSLLTNLFSVVSF